MPDWRSLLVSSSRAASPRRGLPRRLVDARMFANQLPSNGSSSPPNAEVDPDHRRQQRDRRRTGATLCATRYPSGARRPRSEPARRHRGRLPTERRLRDPAKGRRDRPTGDDRLDQRRRSGDAARSGDRECRHRRQASAGRSGAHPSDLRGQPGWCAQHHRAGGGGHGAPRLRPSGLDELRRQLLRLAQFSRLLQQQGGGAPAGRRPAPAPGPKRHR